MNRSEHADTPTRDEFRHVIGHFASGVAVVTATADGRTFGTTASAVTSLSLDPPMVVVCMHRESETGEAMSRSGRFAVNVLEEGQADLAAQLATKDPRKLEGVAVRPTPRGQALLDDALAHLECRVVEEAYGGTHTVFLAAVESAVARSGAPLAYFRGAFGRFAPFGGVPASG